MARTDAREHPVAPVAELHRARQKDGELLAEDDAKIARTSSTASGLAFARQVNGKDQVYFGGGDGLLYAFDTTPVKDGDSSYIKKVWVVRRRA